MVEKIFVSKNSLILKVFAQKNWWWVSKPILVIDLGPCPTLGRSISFPCCQLQYAAQEVTMSISAFLRPSVCSLIFTRCFAIVSQVFYQCFTSVSPVSHQCFTSVSPVFNHYFTSVSSVFHKCLTYVSPEP